MTLLTAASSSRVSFVAIIAAAFSGLTPAEVREKINGRPPSVVKQADYVWLSIYRWSAS